MISETELMHLSYQTSVCNALNVLYYQTYLL